jgi:hypothetical protein
MHWGQKKKNLYKTTKKFFLRQIFVLGISASTIEMPPKIEILVFFKNKKIYV